MWSCFHLQPPSLPPTPASCSTSRGPPMVSPSPPQRLCPPQLGEEFSLHVRPPLIHLRGAVLCQSINLQEMSIIVGPPSRFSTYRCPAEMPEAFQTSYREHPALPAGSSWYHLSPAEGFSPWVMFLGVMPCVGILSHTWGSSSSSAQLRTSPSFCCLGAMMTRLQWDVWRFWSVSSLLHNVFTVRSCKTWCWFWANVCVAGW